MDTNILVSATITQGNEFRLLELARKGEYALILSFDILEEFEGVISREKFGFSQEVIDSIVEDLIRISYLVEPKEKINVIKEDPEDNKFLGCASAGKAQYIVSGDKHILGLKKWKKHQNNKDPRNFEDFRI